MRPLQCFKIRTLLDRRRAGLSEADRLLLEEHLSACDACGQHARELDRLLAFTDSMPSRISSSARDRMIERALATPLDAPDAVRSGRVPVIAGTLAAIAAGAMLIALSSPEPEPALPLLEDRVVAGEILLDDGTVVRSDPIPARSSLFAPHGSRIELAHASVDLSDGARIRWDAAAATIHLDRGRLEIEVDPEPRLPFQVETPTFVVVVVGTRFAVNGTGVEVADGEVRVLDREGTVLAEAVRAGERWPEAETREIEEAEMAEDLAPPKRPSSRRIDAAKRLRKAKWDLALRQVESARREIHAALRSGLSRSQKAEARTLLAECALVEGDRARAARLYRNVASRFSDLAAGENALFAAARLEAEGGDPAAARRLLEDYLERHPEGRFHREARRRLRAPEDRGR